MIFFSSLITFFSSPITFFSSPISMMGVDNEDLFFPICTAAGGNDPRAELFTAAQASLMKRNPNLADAIEFTVPDETGFESGGSDASLSLGSITGNGPPPGILPRQPDSLIRRNARPQGIGIGIGFVPPPIPIDFDGFQKGSAGGVLSTGIKSFRRGILPRQPDSLIRRNARPQDVEIVPLPTDVDPQGFQEGSAGGVISAVQRRGILPRQPDSLIRRNARPQNVEVLSFPTDVDPQGYQGGSAGGIFQGITIPREILPRQLPPQYNANNAPPVDGSEPVTSGSYFQDPQDADPNLLKCFKCAIVDRSRIMVDSSDFCQTCFTQYCYDPKNEPTASEIGGRKFVFTLGNERSSKEHGAQLCIGIAAAATALIAIVVMIFLWRRRRQGVRRHEKYSYSYSPINDEDNV